MTIKEKLAFIEKIEEFPSMPSVVLNLMSKLNNPDSTVKELEELINTDPALVSYILKITNSLIFGLREEVYAISRAITLIGMSNLKSLMNSYAIRLLCKSIRHEEAQQYIWLHSLSVGVLTRSLSEKIMGSNQPQAYVLGLLHDIGKIVLYMYDSKNYLDSLESGIVNNMDFVSSEKKIYGYSHIEAGFFMTAKMGFSTTMKNIVLFHHDPEYSSPDDRLSWIVGLANELAHHLDDNKAVDFKKYLSKLQLTEEEFGEVVQSSQEQIRNYRSIL